MGPKLKVIDEHYYENDENDENDENESETNQSEINDENYEINIEYSVTD